MHAWRGYKRLAWGHDVVMPRSGKLTGDPKYLDASMRACEAVITRRSSLDLLGTSFDVERGVFTEPIDVAPDEPADSFHEYLWGGRRCSAMRKRGTGIACSPMPLFSGQSFMAPRGHMEPVAALFSGQLYWNAFFSGLERRRESASAVIGRPKR
jgi:hypothetical protein